MAQFDVHRLRGGELVVDCQADLLNDLPTRIVAPLVPDQEHTIARLMPAFDINGHRMTMMTPLVRGVARRDIKETIGSLAEHDHMIKIALDMLISGY